MFGIGGQELVLILLLALVILGPKRLPDMARTLGKALGDFQRATQGLQDEITSAANTAKSAPQAAHPSGSKATEKGSSLSGSETDEVYEEVEFTAEFVGEDDEVSQPAADQYDPDEIEG